MTIGTHTLPTEILRTCTDGFFICFSDWAFEITLGTFWMFALLSFCVILFMATINQGFGRALGFAGAIGLLGAVFLSINGLLIWWAASGFMIFGLIAIVILIMSER